MAGSQSTARAWVGKMLMRNTTCASSTERHLHSALPGCRTWTAWKGTRKAWWSWTRTPYLGTILEWRTTELFCLTPASPSEMETTSKVRTQFFTIMTKSPTGGSSIKSIKTKCGDSVTTPRFTVIRSTGSSTKISLREECLQDRLLLQV